MCQAIAHPVAAVFELLEILVHIGMRDRAGERIRNQVLLADIGDVIVLVAFGEQVVERLVAARADLFRDGLVPVLAVGEDRVDIEDHAAEIENPVTDNIANAKAAAGLARGVDGASRLVREKVSAFHSFGNMDLVCGKTSGHGALAARYARILREIAPPGPFSGLGKRRSLR